MGQRQTQTGDIIKTAIVSAAVGAGLAIMADKHKRKIIREKADKFKGDVMDMTDKGFQKMDQVKKDLLAVKEKGKDIAAEEMDKTKSKIKKI